MKIKVNDCCDCGLPCPSYCSLRDDSYIYVCDACDDETQLYEYDGQELCLSCIEELLEKIN